MSEMPRQPHAVFASDWLALREPADHAARAPTLTHAAATWLSNHAHAPYRVVDLGSGSGSNLRYLAPRLPGPQYWRLVDHDPALLARAERDCAGVCDRDGQPVAVETCIADVGDDLDALLGAANLVTAAALFDLVTHDWLARLAAACAARAAAGLFVLSVDGDIHFDDAARPAGDPDDAWVLETLAAHQRRDKGLGSALGTHAPTALTAAFEQAGYASRVATSPWHLGADSSHLAAALIDGWRAAVAEQAPDAAARIQRWADRRGRAVAAGALALHVGHRDIFVQPSAPRA